jgi:hypothetical protein
VERAAFVREPVHQAASPAAVLRIILQDFSTLDGLHDFIQSDLLFNHLLVRVLRHAERSGSRLRLDSSDQGFEFHSVRLPHPLRKLLLSSGGRASDPARQGMAPTPTGVTYGCCSDQMPSGAAGVSG